MRYQGRITTWKDDQGFGFITPNGGGPEIFLHVKALANRIRRPVEQEIVTYEISVNKKGQPRAENVAFVGDRTPIRNSPQKNTFPQIFAVFFLAFIAVAVFTGNLPGFILGLYFGASAIAFLAYAIDKSAAKNDRRRTQESTLHLFALIGGWPGALFAQRMLRHKSKKQSFQVTFWFTVAINCSALGWLFSPSGMKALQTFMGAL